MIIYNYEYSDMVKTIICPLKKFFKCKNVYLQSLNSYHSFRNGTKIPRKLTVAYAKYIYI